MARIVFYRIHEDGSQDEKSFDAAPGERLRDVLLAQGVTPHNGNASWFNCKGFGTCGTCAVEVREGELGERMAREKWRLDFPPHQSDRASGRLRLACQMRVEGDLEIVKHPGFWGENISE